MVDFIAYPDASVIDQLYLARLRAGEPVSVTGKLTRFRIPLKSDAPAQGTAASPGTTAKPSG